MHHFNCIKISKNKILFSPVQMEPFPVNPELHVQVKPPTMLVHSAFVSQSCVSTLHSFISGNIIC